jgi:hypothetical protein
MKKAFSFILVAASLLLASGAQAQGIHVRVDVPFDFTIDKTSYAAGNYDIQALNTSSQALVLSSDKQRRALVLPHACAKMQGAEDTVLVFHRVGDEYFLYQIWVAGSDMGREFTAPKREARLARNGEKSQEIIVAANLVK